MQAARPPQVFPAVAFFAVFSQKHKEPMRLKRIGSLPFERKKLFAEKRS